MHRRHVTLVVGIKYFFLYLIVLVEELTTTTINKNGFFIRTDWVREYILNYYLEIEFLWLQQQQYNQTQNHGAGAEARLTLAMVK
jgi:hypothetical protein